jgi:hypothetical protein
MLEKPTKDLDCVENILGTLIDTLREKRDSWPDKFSHFARFRRIAKQLDAS